MFTTGGYHERCSIVMAEEEQWSQCCEWLKRVGLIGSDHLLATNQARLSDLCRFLRDGVMLCNLLHLLDENSINLRSINKRPQKARVLYYCMLVCVN